MDRVIGVATSPDEENLWCQHAMSIATDAIRRRYPSSRHEDPHFTKASACAALTRDDSVADVAIDALSWLRIERASHPCISVSVEALASVQTQPRYLLIIYIGEAA